MNLQRLCGLLALLCAVLGYSAAYGWAWYGEGYSMLSLGRLMWYSFFAAIALCGLGHVITPRRTCASPSPALELSQPTPSQATLSPSTLSVDEYTALRQTLEYLSKEERKSHQGYFYNGWAGRQLRRLLERSMK